MFDQDVLLFAIKEMESRARAILESNPSYLKVLAALEEELRENSVLRSIYQCLEKTGIPISWSFTSRVVIKVQTDQGTFPVDQSLDEPKEPITDRRSVIMMGFQSAAAQVIGKSIYCEELAKLHPEVFEDPAFAAVASVLYKKGCVIVLSTNIFGCIQLCEEKNQEPISLELSRHDVNFLRSIRVNSE